MNDVSLLLTTLLPREVGSSRSVFSIPWHQKGGVISPGRFKVTEVAGTAVITAPSVEVIS